MSSTTGSRDGAIARAEKYFDDGGFLAELQRRVAIPTTSQEKDSMPALQEYVSGEMSQSLQKMGYDCTVLPNPRAEYGPFLIARRIEDPAKPTVLTYGHGDVIRGQEEQWRQGLSPWKIVVEGDRMYGRGTADNKGQHTINIAALGLRARGARLARLQLDHPDRDRRGDRLAGPGRLLQGQQGGAQGRCADRLGRAAGSTIAGRPSSAARAAP